MLGLQAHFLIELAIHCRFGRLTRVDAALRKLPGVAPAKTPAPEQASLIIGDNDADIGSKTLGVDIPVAVLAGGQVPGLRACGGICGSAHLFVFFHTLGLLVSPIPIQLPELCVPIALFDLDNTLIAGDSDHCWGEFVCKRGLADPSLPQPSSSRPFHYKPIDFVFYDIDAPKRQGLNTVEELVQYLMANDDDEEEDEDMEPEPPKAVPEKAASVKLAGALKSSSYAAPPVRNEEPMTQLQKILASAAQPSSGPERNITGESCLLTAFVDPVSGL